MVASWILICVLIGCVHLAANCQYDFVISMGPPGTGKSKVSEYWMNKDEREVMVCNHFEELNVDTIVANNEKYQEKMGTFFDENSDINEGMGPFIFLKFNYNCSFVLFRFFFVCFSFVRVLFLSVQLRIIHI
jgi:hypothetical protein